MANPRVFISSTCYDLSEVRDSLVDFIESFGFDPILSERGDVFYHPDIHTHDSCINEIGNCHLFILLIGGRFGGNYISDTSKSIVNAEYAAAKEKKIPVFTFVKRNVFFDHNVFLKNKSNKALDNIVFPSIETNANAKKIFTFIDDVRLSSNNNGYFPFDFARDITSLLRKQWAGMFFEFLEQRNSQDQLKETTGLLKNISIASEKVEELIKSIYRHIDVVGAEAKIDSVEKKAICREFFEGAFDEFVRDQIKMNDIDSFITTPRDGKWYEYIANATGGKIEKIKWNDEQGDFDAIAVVWSHIGSIVDSPDEPKSSYSIKSKNLQSIFERLKTLSDDELRSIVSDFDFLNQETMKPSRRVKKARR